MGATKKIIEQNNLELIKNLIPDKSTPIYGNSLTNCNDPIFDKSFEGINYDVILEIIEHQEFLTEFEKISTNKL